MDAYLIRYADDMLILCNPHDAELILNNLREQLGKIHLSLNMDKTRITEAHKGFNFLSFHFIRKYDAEKGKDVKRFFPSVSATRHFREKVRIILNRKGCRSPIFFSISSMSSWLIPYCNRRETYFTI